MGCSTVPAVWIAVAAALLVGSPRGLAAEPVASPLDFNRDVRPILSENCFYCHGQDGQKREDEACFFHR